MADEKASRDLVEDGLMTIPEAEDYSRLSRSALYALMETGQLAYCKLGRRRLIPRRAITEMARKNLVVRESALV